MKKRYGKRDLEGMLCFVLVVLVFICWVKNLIKLYDCDFQAPYKAEVVYAAGINPIFGVVTCWLDVGK